MIRNYKISYSKSTSVSKIVGLKFLLLTLFLSIKLFAGNSPIDKAKIDFKKMNLLYEATPSYSLDIQYRVYDSHINGNLVENKAGKYVKYNSSSYTKLLDIVTIVNPKNTIVVNNEDKALIISDTKKMELSPLQTNLDTILNLCNSLSYTDLGVTQRHYVMVFDDDENSEFSQIDIFINLSNFSLNKIVLFYNQSLPLNQDDYYAEEKKPRLEIIYKSFKQLTKPSSDITELFNESSYILASGNTFKGSSKYSNYKIINQLNAFRLKKNKSK